MSLKLSSYLLGSMACLMFYTSCSEQKFEVSQTETQSTTSAIESSPSEEDAGKSESETPEESQSSSGEQIVELSRFKIPADTPYQQIHDPQLIAISPTHPLVFQIREHGRENGVTCWVTLADVMPFSENEGNFDHSEYFQLVRDTLRRELGGRPFLAFTTWTKVDEQPTDGGQKPVFLAHVLLMPREGEEMISLSEWMIEHGIMQVSSRMSQSFDPQEDEITRRQKLISLQDLAQGQLSGWWKKLSAEQTPENP